MAQLQQKSGTTNNAVLVVSSAAFIPDNFATALLAASLAFAISGQPLPKVQTANVIERPGTVGQFGNVFARSYNQENREFKEAIASFYSELLAQQEPLGREFEQVLYSNLWDLYVRS